MEHVTIFKTLVHSFIQKYFLGTKFVAGTVLGNGEPDKVPWSLQLSRGGYKIIANCSKCYEREKQLVMIRDDFRGAGQGNL